MSLLFTRLPQGIITVVYNLTKLIGYIAQNFVAVQFCDKLLFCQVHLQLPVRIMPGMEIIRMKFSWRYENLHPATKISCYTVPHIYNLDGKT